MARFCSQCGNTIDEEERFCTNCGTPVDQDIPSQQSSDQTETMLDGIDQLVYDQLNASQENLDSEFVQPSIDPEVSQQQEEDEKPRKKRKRRAIIVTVIVVLALIACSVTAFMVFGSEASEETNEATFGQKDPIRATRHTKIVPRNSSGTALSSYWVKLESYKEDGNRETIYEGEISNDDGFVLDDLVDIPSGDYVLTIKDDTGKTSETPVDYNDEDDGDDESPETLDIQVDEDKESGEDQIDGQQAIYDAFRDVYLNAEKQYGSSDKSMSSYRSGWFTGVFLVELIDFNNDGTEELLLAYNKNSSDKDELLDADDYEVELWQFSEGKAVKVFNTAPSYTNDGAIYLSVYTNDNNQHYLVIETSGSPFDYACTKHYFKDDGSFVQEEICKAEQLPESTTTRYYANGKEVDEPTYRKINGEIFSEHSILYSFSTTSDMETSDEFKKVEEATKETLIKLGVLEANSEDIPSNLSGEYVFSSGAGGWREILTVSSDGTFKGLNSGNLDMGSIPQKMYRCEFTGRFSKAIQDESGAIHVTIDELSYPEPEDLDDPNGGTIEDNVQWYNTKPEGLALHDEIIIYPAGTPTKGLNENCLLWILETGLNDAGDALSGPALFDITSEVGFFKSKSSTSEGSS